MNDDWQAYEAEQNAWRRQLDQNWRAENSWLALAGLHWLEPGESRLGSGEGLEIQLPASAPAYVASLFLEDGMVRLVAPAGSPVRVDGRAVREIELIPDNPGPATLVTCGSLAWIIKREDALLALRLWDNERPERRTFPGREWYSLRREYRVPGRFEPSSAVELFPRTFGIDAALETVGAVHFSLLGRKHVLLALPAQNGGLFLIFRDATSGQTTYKAGRYLITEPPEQGAVVVDFNRAYNPPCVVTDFATCRFPPPANHLPLAIEAGEKYVPLH